MILVGELNLDVSLSANFDSKKQVWHYDAVVDVPEGVVVRGHTMSARRKLLVRYPSYEQVPERVYVHELMKTMNEVIRTKFELTN